MYITVSTAVLDGVTPLESLRIIAETGFEGAELSLPHLLAVADSAEPEAQAEELRAAVDDLGLRMPQVHLTVAAVGSHDDEKRQADLATVERHILLCSRMGIRVGVLHPVGGMPPTLAEYRLTEQVRIDSFARLAEFAARHQFVIAIENTMDPRGEETSAMGRRRFGSVIPELHGVIDAVGAENLGICLDTGHCHVQGIPVGEAVRQVGDRLVGTHIDDNHGQADEHLEPGRGTIDWAECVTALREIGWEGIFNLEIVPLRGQPLAAQVARLSSMLATARWLLER